ncbi:hypothetical protein JTB14_000678 [Gonioctena quinquepunctata]|nr:hypothetical protein JTB14_000678 [Gonioctena quinquepunctata]
MTTIQDSYSEDCLKTLQRIVEDIPSGVSEEYLRSIFQVKSSNELHGHLNSSITSACKVILPKFWTQLQIGEKLLHLKELERTSPNKEAWRPVTGKVDDKPFIMDRLLKLKEGLEQELDALRNESAPIKLQLKGFHEQTCQQRLQCE